MSHKHEQLLRSVLHEPVSANIHWREVESLLHHLGAEIVPAHGARFRVSLNGVEGFLHHPHHSNVCSRQDIRHLRDFLVAAKVAPAGGDEKDRD